MKKMYINRQQQHIFLGNNRRSTYGKKKPKITPMAVGVALAFLLLVCAIVYSAADSYNKKTQVKAHISNAQSYTEAKDYSSAVDEYNRALKISSSAYKPEIYRGIIYCYLKDGKTDEAVDYAKLLLARRELKGENFSEAALMINSADPSSAYRLLQTYLDSNKADDPAIQKLIASSQADPVIPQLDMLPGTYVKLTELKFKPDDEHFGHSIYYTTNNEAPDEFSKIYRGAFPIEESTDLRAVSFNADAKASETGLYSFTIDKEMLETLENLVTDTKKLSDATEVGVKAGQCSQVSKDRLNATVDAAKALLARPNILYMDAENHVAYLNDAAAEFNSRINKDVDRQTLDSFKNFADEIFLAVGRASIANNVKPELDALSEAIAQANAVSDTQDEITAAYHTLYQRLLDLNFAGYKAAYKALLISNDCNSYIIYDVNGDMIPELILNRGTNNENYFYTYSVQQGETVRVDTDETFSGIKKFYNHHDGLLGCSTEDGTGEFRLITFVNNKPQISDVLEEYSTSETLRTSLSPVQVSNPGSIQQRDEY